jgi:nucleoside-triphosphatase THEP1
LANSRIYILTGEKHSGKTTRLLNAIQNRDNVYGILTPDIDGQRFFMDIRTKELFPMEAQADEPNALVIGKYRFNEQAFQKAIAILEEESKRGKGWLIIDEVGPLELKKSGFYNVILKLLRQHNEMKIVAVIRNGLVEELTQLFGITNYTIIENELPK